MARVKGGVTARKRHKKVLRQAKGYYGAKSKIYRPANQAVMKSLNYAYSGRKQRKRDFRKLWISRINAAARQNGMSYSAFIHGLKKANIEINRKMLSEMAIHDPDGFKELVEIAKGQ
ncbi:LSU ribosomal protein L20P [Keratinibaculum paraultunense]|uniref:Large ribosomal subunit protein bL20 n=1 Tax=Keratinibaculum paraultunense TaxID=1278232 RepID=A0A4R3KZQ1_9FIRM|nr:50S ribosomal protein L20 [Keratinibaculum paraultunense]QQY80370.1 50S ribosomal protein L20 [Keratinibaculum paraultunense]TCS90897.1 LSU ribosomal protein L20P [Keratinibaculum paraultunense]